MGAGRRIVIQKLTFALALGGVGAVGSGSALAQQNLAQTPLSGKNIPQWVQPLPLLTTTPGQGIQVLDGTASVTLSMCEFRAQVLPPPFPPTWVWGYIPGSSCPSASDVLPTYIGPVIAAERGTPTQVTYMNQLGTAEGTNVLAYKYSVDQTLHWADPQHGGMNECAMEGGVPAFGTACSLTYQGPVPAVPHLHGGEVPPEIDGGPEAWFTNASSGLWGPGYYSLAGSFVRGAATYRYPNTQQSGPLWFHDHTLGATRLNVYAGLAGAYYLADPGQELPAGLPSVGEMIPVVLQDRMFDTNAQLFFPADMAGGVLDALNPEHPYWVPEFIGDAIVVNGKAWPYLEVEPKRYRALFLNGSNARTYELSLPPGVPMWVIGNDGGFLDSAVPVEQLAIMPGERYEAILDFTGFNPGKNVILQNTARAPYPRGAPPIGSTMGEVIQFRVIACKAAGTCGASNTTWNPAVTPILRAKPMVRLVNAGAPVDASVKRMLTLNEVMGMPPKTATDPVTGSPARYPGGPLEILVNNTRWSGTNRPDFTSFPTNPMTTFASELPHEGSTELWEIVNLTADAHPIHLHLVQFQLLNRQAFDVKKYSAVYAAAFPGTGACAAGVYCPGFGPPLGYNDPNGAGALGGNPDVGPFLKAGATPRGPQESGWKDTVMVPPGMVTRFVVRWAPTDAPADASAPAFPFDPSGGGHFGYVWHCHIIDHEDNEMMRPDYVVKLESSRSYIKGVHY